MGFMKNFFPDLEFPRVRASDPITSFQAADKAKELASRHCLMIVEALKMADLGKDGISNVTGLDSNQVARRLSELQKMGLIELTGKTVLSKSKRSEREWRLVK